MQILENMANFVTRRINNVNGRNMPYYCYTAIPGPPVRLICQKKNCKCTSHGGRSAGKYTIPGYQFLKFLGYGSYGAVHLYRHCKTRKPVAIKSLSYISPEGRNNFFKVTSEYDIVIHFNHPNILKYFNCFINPATKKCYISMEYASRGSLRKLINDHRGKNLALQPRFILNIIRDILTGVQFLNFEHVVHSDLKPENILRGNDNRIKIGDFGTAHYEFDVNAALALTATYMAPEQFNNVRPNEKTEIWAIGVIMYELCYLRHPFGTAKTIEQLIRLVRSGQLAPFENTYGNEIVGFMLSMLSVNPQNRHTLSNLLKNNVLRQ